MRIDSVNKNKYPLKKLTNRKNDQSFGAKVYFYRTVQPYLQQQAYNRYLVNGEQYANDWYKDVAENIVYIGKQLESVLNSDTPIVLAVTDNALNAAKSSDNKIFNGLDGILVIDGQSRIVDKNECTANLIEDARKPFLFRFSSDKTIADKAVAYFKRIPIHVASIFKPWE